jgi:hypothetical protein
MTQDGVWDDGTDSETSSDALTEELPDPGASQGNETEVSAQVFWATIYQRIPMLLLRFHKVVCISTVHLCWIPQYLRNPARIAISQYLFSCSQEFLWFLMHQ